MKDSPRFELTRVFENGNKEAPKIIPVTSLPWETKVDRRGFLGTGLLVSAAFLATSGCATSRKKIKIKAWDDGAKKWRYNEYYDKVTKTWKTFTLPCGSPIPPGATCTCNCVPVTAPRQSYGTRTICTCNKVCTCVPVRY